MTKCEVSGCNEKAEWFQNTEEESHAFCTRHAESKGGLKLTNNDAVPDVVTRRKVVPAKDGQGSQGAGQ